MTRQSDLEDGQHQGCHKACQAEAHGVMPHLLHHPGLHCWGRLGIPQPHPCSQKAPWSPLSQTHSIVPEQDWIRQGPRGGRGRGGMQDWPAQRKQPHPYPNTALRHTSRLPSMAGPWKEDTSDAVRSMTIRMSAILTAIATLPCQAHISTAMSRRVNVTYGYHCAYTTLLQLCVTASGTSALVSCYHGADRLSIAITVQTGSCTMSMHVCKDTGLVQH